MYQTGIVFEGIQGCGDHFRLSDERAVSSDLAFQNCIYLALEKKSKTKNSTALQKKQPSETHVLYVTPSCSPFRNLKISCPAIILLRFLIGTTLKKEH